MAALLLWLGRSLVDRDYALAVRLPRARVVRGGL